LSEPKEGGALEVKAKVATDPKNTQLCALQLQESGALVEFSKFGAWQDATAGPANSQVGTKLGFLSKAKDKWAVAKKFLAMQ
jgi:hypothetical protein